MIPLKDDVPSETFPFVTLGLVALNVLVFLYQTILLFPFASVHMLLIFGFFARVVRWPALVVLGFWIVLQALSGILTFSRAAWGGGEAGGTAWFAHIGGFLTGVALLFLMRPRRAARL